MLAGTPAIPATDTAPAAAATRGSSAPLPTRGSSAPLDVIEFQKRGLPTAHMLITLHPDDKPKCAAENYLRFTTAEFTTKHTREHKKKTEARPAANPVVAAATPKDVITIESQATCAAAMYLSKYWAKSSNGGLNFHRLQGQTLPMGEPPPLIYCSSDSDGDSDSDSDWPGLVSGSESSGDEVD